MTLALARESTPSGSAAPLAVTDEAPDYDQLRHDQFRHDALAWRRAGRADIGWEHPYENYLRYLDALVGARLDDVRDGVSEPELLARAVAFFTDDYPDEDERTELLTIHALTGANFYDLALAWSVGWNPIRAPRPARAIQPSDVALFALIEQAAASTTITARMLAERAGLAVLDRDEHSSMAALFGMALSGRCDCGHHVRGCTGCGRGCCFPDHDLRTWDPYRCHLRPFVDQAIRGTAQRRIMGGAFAASMLFRALEREGTLLCRTVEWGRCDLCGRLFEGLHCPEPHPHQPGSIRREPRKNQLIRPAARDGGHLPIQRWWCAPCGHLYGAAGGRSTETEDCPRCAQPPTRRMTVWARMNAVTAG